MHAFWKHTWSTLAVAASLAMGSTACDGEAPGPESPASVDDVPPPTAEAPPPPLGDLEAAATRCAGHWTAGCVSTQNQIEDSCLLPGKLCTTLQAGLRVARARSTCEEGSVAECQAACDSRQPYACVLLAQMAYLGTRAPKDPQLGETIAGASCKLGAQESCVERALWLEEEAPSESATLAMKACTASDPVPSSLGCTLWMQLLEKGAYSPTQPELVAGLQRVCTHERVGDVQPGTPLATQQHVVLYNGGACGRLKDLGLRP